MNICYVHLHLYVKHIVEPIRHPYIYIDNQPDEGQGTFTVASSQWFNFTP